MGRGKLMLYSLVLQPLPLFKHYHQAIRTVILPRSLVTKCTTFISAWGTCALHPPCTFKEGLTTTLLARTPLFFGLTRAFPFSVAAFAATELQFFPHALKLRLLRVLKLLRSSHLHHGIKDHLHTKRPSLAFSPAPLRSSSPTVVLMCIFPLVFLPFHSPSICPFVFPADPLRTPLLSPRALPLF
ncbi:hypothetical protein O181_124335 [Austropuccinia psidii MF-1]|uniref:Uncharacterized protein n=1 Tax=Austropuccinia psidii MF-1 TaxID=1389203 RepID=A0A9Q3KSZ7_9BASI|nr:hypothetical protein [Austropuccinia psidii MF-1]